uniref:Uncharacterized protein n=1 Tax=Glossina austeni TaxID=7395 RepID=A0A1A9UHF4_GLOAU
MTRIETDLPLRNSFKYLPKTPWKIVKVSSLYTSSGHSYHLDRVALFEIRKQWILFSLRKTQTLSFIFNAKRNQKVVITIYDNETLCKCKIGSAGDKCELSFRNSNNRRTDEPIQKPK